MLPMTNLDSSGISHTRKFTVLLLKHKPKRTLFGKPSITITRICLYYELSFRTAFATLAQSVPQLIAQPANSLTISSPNPLVLIPGSQPLLQSDYPNIKFWTRHSWTAANKKANNFTTVRQKAPERGGTRMANDENVSMRFIEDAEGAVIGGHRAQDIRRRMRTVFNHLAAQPGGPAATWTGYADIKQRYYYQEMANAFPELRFCELSWKADKLAIDAYPSWYQTYLKKGIKVEIKAEGTEDIPAPSIPQKRSRSPSLTSKQKNAKHAAAAYVIPTPVQSTSTAASTLSLELISTTSASLAPSSATRPQSPEPLVSTIIDTQPITSLIDGSGSTQHNEDSVLETAILPATNEGGKGKAQARDVEMDSAAPPQKVCLL